CDSPETNKRRRSRAGRWDGCVTYPINARTSPRPGQRVSATYVWQWGNSRVATLAESPRQVKPGTVPTLTKKPEKTGIRRLHPCRRPVHDSPASVPDDLMNAATEPTTA